MEFKLVQLLCRLALACSLLACSPSLNTGDDDLTSEVLVDRPNCNNSAISAPMCDFMLFDQNENPFILSNYTTKHILIDISAAWCAPCQAAARDVQYVQDLYEQHGLLYVTILIENSSGENPSLSDAQTWADVNGITTSPVLMGNTDIIGYRPDQFSLTALPSFWYVDSGENQVIEHYHQGWSSSLIESNVRVLLGL